MGLGPAYETDDGRLLFIDGYRVMKLDPWGNVVWEYEGNWREGNVSRVSSTDFLITGQAQAEVAGEQVEVATITKVAMGTDPPIREDL